MDNAIQLALIIAIVGLALVMLLLWLRVRPQKETRDDKGDNLKLDTVSPFQFNGIDEVFKTRILEAINRMGAVGDNAEEDYQASLKALQADSAKVIRAVGEELEVVPASRYLDRWSLIQLLAELRDPSSLPLLDTILSKPMPVEKFKDTHAKSSLRQETINLTTTVEAINRIASKGSENALELLIKHATHESLSVRRACVQSYMAHGGQQARENLKEVLSQTDYFLLDIQKTHIKEVPQIKVDASVMPSRFTSKINDVPQVTPKRD